MIRNPILLLVGLLCVSGCGYPALFQAETTIRPDGTCDRSIWQRKGEMLPDGALDAEWRTRWRTVEDVAAPPVFLAENPRPDPDHAYFHAEGSFSSPAAIPPHYLKRLDGHPELGASELVRSHERDDYGLIVAHRWSETITNIVTRDDYRKAADQFIDVSVPMFRRALEEVFSREYDVTALGDEIEKRSRPFLDEMLDMYYEVQANPDADFPESLRPRFLAALRDVGVKIPENAPDPDINQAARDCLRDMILRDVKRRDGRPMTSDDVWKILNDPSAPAFKEDWERYVEAHKDELDAKLVPLVVRLTGLYNYPPIFTGSAPEFVFGLRLPGWVVETNGTIGENGRVAWRFNGSQLFPGGFEMRAESLDVDRPAQTRLLGRVVVDDAESARALRDLVANDEGLADLLRRAGKAGDPAILRDFQPKSDEQRARFDRLLNLLQLQN